MSNSNSLALCLWVLTHRNIRKRGGRGATAGSPVNGRSNVTYKYWAVGGARFCSSTVPCAGLCSCRKLIVFRRACTCSFGLNVHGRTGRNNLRDNRLRRSARCRSRDTCVRSHTMLAGANGLRCRDRVQTGVETGVETAVNYVETVETAREGFLY